MLSLKLNNKSINIDGFSHLELAKIFNFCSDYFETPSQLLQEVQVLSHHVETIQPPQVIPVDDLRTEPTRSSQVDDIKSPHELIPKIMDWDSLKKFMVSSFPENKIDTNIQNSRVLKQLFTGHLKVSQFNIETLKNTKLIFSAIKDRTEVAQKSIISSISKAFQMYLQITPSEYIQKMKDLTDQIEKDMKQRVMNTKEEENMISDVDIQNAWDKYRDSTDLQGRQMYLMLLLYTKMEPVRLDYVNMLIGDSNISKTENYINLSTGHIFLRKYKTSSTYGDKVLKVNDEILDYIKSLVNYRKEQGIVSDYLFINHSNYSPMIKSTFCKTLNAIFGKSVSVNILRKKWVSSHIDADQIERDETMADKMMHSVEVQKLVYCKKMPKSTKAKM